MKATTFIGLGLLGGGAYLAWEYYKKNGLGQMAALEAHDQWEMMGYLNGLMRGAGSYNNALDALWAWRDYWMAARPDLSDIIMEWFNYGHQRAEILYSGGQ